MESGAAHRDLGEGLVEREAPVRAEGLVGDGAHDADDDGRRAVADPDPAADAALAGPEALHEAVVDDAHGLRAGNVALVELPSR